MNNFDHAVEATETALNSAGSAARENGRYMEGLEAKTQAVAASFEALSNTVVDSGLIKGILDLSKGFLDLSNNAIGAFLIQFGLLTGVLWGGTGLIKAMKVIPNFIAGITKTVTTFNGVLSLTAPQLALISAGLVTLVSIGSELFSIWKEAHPTLEMIDEDISDLNTELETNQTRLQELESIPWADRTTAQKAETEEIKAQNAELEKNIQLKYEQRASVWGQQNISTGKYQIGNIYGMEQFKEYENLLFETSEQAYAFIDGEEALQDALASGQIIIEERTLSIQDYINEGIAKLNEYNQILQNNGQLTADQKAEYQELIFILGGYLSELDAMNYGTVLQANGLDEVRDSLESSLAPAVEYTRQLEIIADHLYLTKKQADEIIAQNPNLANSIVQVGDAYYLEANALVDLSNTQKQATKEIIEQNKARLQSSVESVEKEIAALRNLLVAWERAGLQGNKVYTNVSGLVGEKESEIKEYQDSIAYLDSILAGMSSKISFGGGGESDSATVSQSKTLLDILKEELEILDHQAFLAEKNGESQEKIVEIYKNAQQRLHEVAEQYRKQGYSDTSKEIRELQTLWWGYADKIDEVYKSIEENAQESAENAKKAWEEAQDELISNLNDKKDAYDTAFSYMVDKIQEEIDALEKQRDIEEQYWDDKIAALEKQNEEIEQQIELEELQDQLARARQSQVMVYKDGRFQYVSDVDAVSEAQTNLESYEREEALRQETENLERLKEQALAAIDEQIAGWEEYKEAWTSVADDYQEEQDKLLAEQVLGIKLEGENWKTRLDNLEDYVNQYKELMKELASAQVSYEEAKSNVSNAIKESASEVANALSNRKPFTSTTNSRSVSSSIFKTYASGTTYSSEGISLVGENGPELRVLGKGEGIIPSDITKNLWAWGVTTPASMINTIAGSLQSMGQNIGITIQNFNPNLPGITDGQGFANYMRNNFWREAIQFAKT